MTLIEQPESAENGSTLALVLAELEKAVTKFPTWPTRAFDALAVVDEEVGELHKAVLQYVYEPHKGVTVADIREEAVQSAAMVLRWIASIDQYDFTPTEQHNQPVHAVFAALRARSQGGE